MKSKRTSACTLETKLLKEMVHDLFTITQAKLDEEAKVKEQRDNLTKEKEEIDTSLSPASIPQLTEFSLADGKSLPFLSHWDEEEIKRYGEAFPGSVFEGNLQVRKHNFREGYIKVRADDRFKEYNHEIVLHGRGAMNRGVHGDRVCVILLPPSQWISSSGKHVLVETTTHEVVNEEDSIVEEVDIDKIKKGRGGEGGRRDSIPTGQVVKILERRRREYVAVMQESDIEGLDPNRDYEEVRIWIYTFNLFPIYKYFPFFLGVSSCSCRYSYTSNPDTYTIRYSTC
jgi:exoribonuclease R